MAGTTTGESPRNETRIETDELIELEMTINNEEEDGDGDGDGGEGEEQDTSNQQLVKPPRRPPTFEAAFSQARSLTNHGRVNYQQALINNNHSSRGSLDSLALLPPPPPPPAQAENNLQSLRPTNSSIEQLHLTLPGQHDPDTHFLTSLVGSETTADQLIFSPHHQQVSLSPPTDSLLPIPRSPSPLLDEPNSSPPGLYGSSPPPDRSQSHESPPPSPPAPRTVRVSPPKNPTGPPRPPPLKLCLPPRPRRPAIETSQTPYNSPAGSNPSTPLISTSNLRPVSNQSNLLKRTLPSSSTNPHQNQNQNQTTTAKKQKINPLFLVSSTSKTPAENEKLKAWKRIQLLRAQRDQPQHLSSSGSTSKNSEELERLEKSTNSNSLGDTLSSAIQLRNQAQEYLDLIQKTQDALGEELVRVQLEESVLRHVRGIIADRLIKNQEWNNQNS
ncbi:hypothetical protein PGTUg99_013583 [Puccinia graminis f. sp. tritici]|uniref:Uncharacterized protein n=1 Tax=Puccinia graminis f. sp. tritici TaxID=56615 RepID=A0A5B0RM74_PUCGR|nr:hypothetical protein PGTUg99_013583 [Puccinia graminis f. sp. tritici]